MLKKMFEAAASFDVAVFLLYRKLLRKPLYSKKALRATDAHSRDRYMSLTRPRSARERSVNGYVGYKFFTESTDII